MAMMALKLIPSMERGLKTYTEGVSEHERSDP
jgi:hypothetical protein